MKNCVLKIKNCLKQRNSVHFHDGTIPRKKKKKKEKKRKRKRKKIALVMITCKVTLTIVIHLIQSLF